ncbi:hypothetical protein IFVP69_C180574 [Vibrio parahaemolyticus]
MHKSKYQPSGWYFLTKISVSVISITVFERQSAWIRDENNELLASFTG